MRRAKSITSSTVERWTTIDVRRRLWPAVEGARIIATRDIGVVTRWRSRRGSWRAGERSRGEKRQHDDPYYKYRDRKK